MEKELYLCKIDPDYLKFLHKIDSRVSVKHNNRPFVGVISMVENVPYVLPLTSQTTQIRKEEGKSKRSSMITTFIKDSDGTEIANILHNNMIPVQEDVYTLLEINAETDTYESNEIRYIRKNREQIIRKAEKVYRSRTTKSNAFLNKTCCDFKKLEEHCAKFEKE